ncbi:MAG: hypothetical protein DRI40_07030 [Chloroflexi bacterium]|nr:MAG: hypothetical protein DRI40_07030 [Chloroflexota bacterium]
MAASDRLERLRRQLRDEGLDGAIISCPENQRYLAGFTGGTGLLIVSQDAVILGTDFIHFEQAKKEATGVQVVRVKGGMTEGLSQVVHDQVIRRLGFEAEAVTFAEHERMLKEADKLRIELVPTEGLVESLRAVKEASELDCISRATETADRAVAYIARKARPGMTEREMAWEIERFLRENGSEKVPFPIIVASGPNAALPHAVPTERAISPGDPVIIDLGATVEGYSSDLSRTLCLGTPDEKYAEVYGLVLKAQLFALEGLRVGMTGAQVDSLARQVIKEAGYGDAFGHGLGHGVGLAVHEKPRLGPNSDDLIVEDMVFTIEPGIYLPGWGGVRIEDTVVVRDGKAEALTRADK